MSEFNICYQVSPVNLSEHLLEVQLTANLPQQDVFTLTLPAWIPGSYMIRDFARNIICINCEDNGISLTKLDKQSWQVRRKDQQTFGQFVLTYRVFAFDLSVRSAFINHEYAFFNGTSALLNVVEHDDVSHFVHIQHTEFTKDWQTVTAMPVAETSPFTLTEPHALVYHCPDYATLIDSPVLMGQLCMQSFEVEGVRFHVVFTGDQTMDLARICEDLTPICAHHIQLFGESPVSEYWFMTLLCDKGFGGLEHKASTVLQYSRFDLPMLGAAQEKTESYQQFLSLCSHELFHTWHVKRIKPEIMVNPNLSEETYTPQLWIYEGFTSLYDDLTLARTGVITPEQYCQILAQSITRLMRNPGRHLQSVSESSFDAWTRFYKQDANSVNHIVSYYLKGSIIALALDINIRQQSGNTKSLDDIMRSLWHRYGKHEIGTPDDVISMLCKQDLDLDLDSFIHVAASTTMDLPLSTLINSVGLTLHMRCSEGYSDKGGKPASIVNSRDMGANLSDDIQGVKVNQVLASSAAAAAGLQVGDIIIACKHYKATLERLSQFLESTALGESVLLHVMRDNQLIQCKLEAREAPLDTCYISINNETLLYNWLGIDTA
ncbi:PDZ domain-containing protein [Glaciecola sp. XM2]|uniref:M61 family metallopeptidase n=1 Tax=Glaciecola sp. XM2 TaxID=1914931 RepID=UPI001BDF1D9B|nr:PDZ domain-containing protein [Glaciecola sp. XM2]MBT1451960.1 PDZ domain-containing protein [Glaciecola sp. XM2]